MNVVRSSDKYRCRATNEPTAFLEGVDGRSVIARRFRDLVAAIVEDLGGAEAITEGELQLVRRAASLCVQCELLEAEAARGAALEVDSYVKLVNALNRTLGSIGLKRRPRDVTPDLRDYVETQRL